MKFCKKSPPFILGALLLAFLMLHACSKLDDTGQEAPVSSPKSLTMTEDHALSLSYDMVTSTYIVAAKPEDQEQLTETEKMLRIPKVVGCSVTQYIKDNGLVDADIEMVNFEGMPNYPKRTIGQTSYPDKFMTKRIEVRDGISTFYNAEGKVITSNVQSDAETAYFQKVASELSENTRVSVEEFEYILEAFRQEGFDVEDTSHDPNVAVMTQHFDDGGYTELYIDKVLNHIDSRVNYNAAGEVETISDFIFEDDGVEKTLIGHRFVTFYDSPFSDVKMSIRKVSEIKNFNLQKHL